MIAAPIDSLPPEQLREIVRALQAEMATKEEVIQRQTREAAFKQPASRIGELLPHLWQVAA